MSSGEVWHASAVAVAGQALVCIGQSGSGKSSTCLELMAFGAQLVCDDRVYVAASDASLSVRAVPEVAGLIEARGFGLLRAEFIHEAPIAYILDLDAEPAPRLPQSEFRKVMGHNVPLLRPTEGPHRASALYQLLKFGKADP